MQLPELPPVLMVEDNEDDYDAAARSFKKAHLDHPLQWCRSGREALEYLEHHLAEPPALVLLDLNMPGIDGRATLKRIKQDEALKNIPIIILTTSTDETDIAQCYEQGASSYIQKPVDFESLVRTARLIKEYWFDLARLPHGHPHPH